MESLNKTTKVVLVTAMTVIWCIVAWGVGAGWRF